MGAPATGVAAVTAVTVTAVMTPPRDVRQMMGAPAVTAVTAVTTTAGTINHQARDTGISKKRPVFQQRDRQESKNKLFYATFTFSQLY